MKSSDDFKKKKSPYTSPRLEGHTFESGPSDELEGAHALEASPLGSSRIYSPGVGIEDRMQNFTIGGAGEQVFETVSAYGDADLGGDEVYGSGVNEYSETIGFEPYDRAYLGYRSDGTPLPELPVEMVQKVTDHLPVRDIVALAGTNSSWRNKVLSTKNRRSPKEISMAQLPFLGKTIRTDNPVKLVIKNTEELEEFARMLKTDKKVDGNELKLPDVLEKISSISIENEKEYEQSTEPANVFNRVCKIILPVVRKMEERRIGLFLRAVYIDLNHSRLAKYLRHAKIGNLLLDSNSVVSNKDVQGAESLCLLKNADCITTTPLVVDVEGVDKLEGIKRLAVDKVNTVLRTAIHYSPSMKKLVIDPTILYRDSQGRFVDIDPKREFAIKAINDNVINESFHTRSCNVANVTILLPKAPEEVPFSMGGLASDHKFLSKDLLIELPQECLKRWKQFHDRVTDIFASPRSPVRADLSQVSFSGFGPQMGKPIKRQEGGRFRYQSSNMLPDGQGGFLMVD